MNAKIITIPLFIILIVQIGNAQTGNNCGCGEYPASVTVETVGDPCSPPDLGNDDGSLRRVYDYECCIKKCRQNQTNQNTANKKPKTTNKSNSDLTNKGLTKNLRNSQNEKTDNQNNFNQKLANDLTNTFNQISQSWARERDFQNRISSLTNIQSIDVSSIINEAKSKAQRINIEFNQKKNESLAEGVNLTQNMMNSAQNDDQVIAGGIIGTAATLIGQGSIEKQRKEAQNELERKKDLALKPLIDELIKKIQPTQQKYLDLAEYAVLEREEQEYVNKYKYYSEIITNAKKYIVNEIPIETRNKTLGNTDKNYSAEDYYKAYQRKKHSPYTGFISAFFLELAIDKDNNRKDWIKERVSLENNIAFETFKKLKINSKKTGIHK